MTKAHSIKEMNMLAKTENDYKIPTGIDCKIGEFTYKNITFQQAKSIAEKTKSAEIHPVDANFYFVKGTQGNMQWLRKKKPTCQKTISEIKQQLIMKCLANFQESELVGYEGGAKVYAWFAKNTKHPHPLFTFEREALKRDVSKDRTNAFALHLLKEFALLAAISEHLTK
jgi:hypothetical protein